VDKEIEDIKEKIRKTEAGKEDNSLKGIREKIEQTRSVIRQRLDKEENDILSKINRQCYEKLEEIKINQSKYLSDEKNKILQKISLQNEEKINKIKQQNQKDLENLQKDLNYYKQALEIPNQEDLKQTYAKKLEKLKLDLKLEYENEKKIIEKDIEKQMKSIRQEENGELSIEDQSLLNNLESDLISTLSKEIQSLRAENSSKIAKEKEKIADQMRLKSEKHQIDFELKLKQELYEKETEQDCELKDFLKDYKLKKEEEASKALFDHEQKLIRLMESEEQQSALRTRLPREDDVKILLEKKIGSYQREIANCEHTLYIKNTELNRLKDEELKIRTETKWAEIESEDLKGKEGVIEGVVIADMEKQLFEKENEIKTFENVDPDRISQLEKEVYDLKKVLYRNRPSSADREELEQIKVAMNSEKEDLKHVQYLLKQDREKWNKEMKEYKSNPTERKRTELNNIKKIIEKNIQKHNLRVKELKQAEEMLRINNFEENPSEDEDAVLEMWRNAEPRPSQAGQYTRQPWQNHNLHVYQRQVNKWSKSREYMKDVMTRHGSWLSNMKEQLNRIMSTPHTIKNFH
jgi:hypothetical protein